MKISYKKLWNLLIDKDMMKKDILKKTDECIRVIEETIFDIKMQDCDAE